MPDVAAVIVQDRLERAKDLDQALATRRRANPVGATSERHITHSRGGFRVRLRMNGERRNFGTYDTLDEAKAVRDAALAQLSGLRVGQ